MLLEPRICSQCSALGIVVVGRMAEQGKRRRVAWLKERAKRVGEIEGAPETIEELFDWPKRLLSVIQKDESMWLRLKAIFLQGITLTSDYSGIDCPRESLSRVIDAFRSLDDRVREDVLVTRRTCDIGQLQSTVLIGFNKRHMACRSCHFQDIADRLPASARKFIEEAMPDSRNSTLAKRVAFQRIGDYLANSSSELFSKDSESWCLTHERMCPVVPVPPKDEHPVRLQVNVAGVTCHSWSTAGKQEQTAHVSEVPLAIYMAEKKEQLLSGLVDLVFLECTPRFPAEEKFKSLLGDTCYIVTMTFGPEDLGWPHKRQRIHAAVWKKSAWDWCGPDQKDLEEDFKQKFFRGMRLEGADLMVASDAERWSVYRSMAAGRKNRLPEFGSAGASALSEADLLTAMLPPGAVQRMAEWRAHVDGSVLLRGMRTVMVDIDHHPGSRGCQEGPDWPVQLRHSTIVALQQAGGWKLATPTEHYYAMGWHAESEMLKVVQEQSGSHMKVLCGNSMHLFVQGTFMTYVMSNLRRASSSHESSAVVWDDWQETSSAVVWDDWQET
eukprot:6492749-Amphidinium_carterae.7